MTLLIYNKSIETAFLPLCEKIQKEFQRLEEPCRIFDNRTAQQIKKDDLFFENCVFLDKDAVLGQRLEQWGVRLFNNLGSIELCDDKRKTAEFLQGTFKIPETVCYPLLYAPDPPFFEQFAAETAEKLTLPLVAKLAFGSWGQQVFLLHSIAEIIDFQKKYYAVPHLYCRFIQESAGRDLRVYYADGKAVAAVKRENKTDFRSNIALGGIAENHEFTEQERQTAEEACRFLNLDFGGVDLLFSEDGFPYVCEVNSNAIFTATEEISGVNIARHIAEGIKKKAEKETPDFSKENFFL